MTDWLVRFGFQHHVTIVVLTPARPPAQHSVAFPTNVILTQTGLLLSPALSHSFGLNVRVLGGFNANPSWQVGTWAGSAGH
jgi:hypothetical protein